MAKIFYKGSDGKDYGPMTELDVQGWYAKGFFSSDVRFQISERYQVDLNLRFFTLGELIELNGRALPFYFSPQKENREKLQEDTINRLIEEVESLRLACQHDENSSEQIVAVLESQVASLMESHEDILLKLNGFSDQREAPAIPSQLEERVSDLKKRIDEQAKNFVSMKKELSALNSKCDRCESKLDKLLEKQNQVNGTVNGYDKRISDLKASEKCIRGSIDSCEQKIDSNWNQLKEVKGELCDIKEAIQKEKKNEMDKAVMEDVKASDPWENKAQNGGSTPKSSAPWDEQNENSDRSEPWEQRNAGAKKEQHLGTNKNGPLRDKKKVKASEIPKSSTVVPEVKPEPPRVKDWAAICRNLSSDDEEPDDAKPISHPDVFINDCIELLGAYCTSIESKCAALLKEENVLAEMMRYSLSVVPQSAQHRFIADALKKEVERLASTTITCNVCDFVITTPRLLLLHLSIETHQDKMNAVLPSLEEQGEVILEVFSRFLATREEMYRAMADEYAHTQLGKERKYDICDVVAKRLFSPTYLFEQQMVDECAASTPDEYRRCDDRVGISASEKAKMKKELGTAIRKWINNDGNRRKVQARFDEHFKGAVAHCEDCDMFFEDQHEYCKHMTTYGHAANSQSTFTMLITLWKEHECWNDVPKE